MSESSHTEGHHPHRVRGSTIAGMTVLVVDDELPTRDVVSDILDVYGASALLAEDGTVGIRMFAEFHRTIGAVLLDLSMPGLNGVEVAEKLRAIDPNARIILTSGYTEEDVRKRFPQMQCDGFIQKPYKPDALYRMMERVRTR